MKLSSHPSTAGARRMSRWLGVPVLIGLLFALSACGFGVQTLQPYTPADGVNIDVGLSEDGQPTEDTVKVRGLMILVQPDGSAFLSATLVCWGSDQLTEVTGFAQHADGSRAGDVTVELPLPIDVVDGHPVLLVEQQPNTVDGALTPGLNATLTLTFAEAGSRQVVVPVIDGSRAPYETVTPAAPTATPET